MRNLNIENCEKVPKTTKKCNRKFRPFNLPLVGHTIPVHLPCKRPHLKSSVRVVVPVETGP